MQKLLGLSNLGAGPMMMAVLHVAELSINGSIFYLHEESIKSAQFSPEQYNGTTALIALFVADVDTFMKSATAAGAIEISLAQDYDYGYRQGEVKTFGHCWMLEMKI